MAIAVPHALEDAVHAAAREVLGDAALATAKLARAVVDRSRRYTSARDELGSPADPVADLAARAAFFTIADAMKIAIPIGELAARGALPGSRPLRVADLGAGCGAMTLGLIAATRDRAIEVLAIDRDARALEIARRAVERFTGDAEHAVAFATRTGDATRSDALAAAPYDLVVAGTLLNELAPDPSLALVERALAAISDDGAVILIEPALRDTTRALHAIRDAVIARGRGHVFAPCTRRAAPCPALVDPRDWCHEDRPLVLPPRTAELARLTHLRDGGMKLSYLVLRRRALDLVEAGDQAWRIVGTPGTAKGKHELIGCSARGRVPLRLLRRHRTAGNRGFEEARRGDVLAIDAPAGDDRVEILADTRVRRC